METRNSPLKTDFNIKKKFMKQLDEQALHIWNQHMLLSSNKRIVSLASCSQSNRFLHGLYEYLFYTIILAKKHKTEQINTPP